MNNDFTFEKTFERKLIYVFRINDDAHKGFLKIGEATVKSDFPNEKLQPFCSELNKSAQKRIDEYTRTANISYELLWSELAIREELTNDNEIEIKAFRDHTVHNVLKNSGIKNVKINNQKGKEWFKTDLETVKNAIKAVKEGRKTLSGIEITTDRSPIEFRPEQKKAIELTVKRLKKTNSMLWNAKMRFGKTVCALQVAKELEEIGVKRTIIATHRPVVNDGWQEDFKKIFYNRDDYHYLTKESKEDIRKLEKEDKNFIYFASLQDLRGSEVAGGKFDKNIDVFEIKWDLVIIDEAHEGTTTEKGESVKELLITKEHTKVIELSGTPFNIISKYGQDEVYTWDYIMEQRAKKLWDEQNCGDSNPYEELPQMKIFTYDLGESLGVDEYNEIGEKAFNFKEFFRTWTEYDNKKPADAKIGDFVHEKDINNFLNLISSEVHNTNYPYANEKYRNLFKHSLWMLPGIKEAKALKELLKKHPVFNNEQFFKIVNIAGDEEYESSNALDSVRAAIKNGLRNNAYTITLSCGKLTTGVTIPEWTAVLMLSGSYSTSAANYLQTIFRVQSPANINGMRKECCYVFDFAPDRTLKMIADAVQLSTKAGKTNDTDRRTMGEFLNFCPVISISGSRMEKYDENKLLQQLKKAYAERAVKSGFEDSSLYNDNLFELNKIDLEKFKNLNEIVKSSKQSKKTHELTMNNQGLTNEQREQLEKIKNKPKKGLTFSAVVGNPPYQENISNDDNNSSLSKQLFPLFITNTILLNAKYVSLITPSRWFTADAQDKSFIKLRDFIKKNNHMMKIYNYKDANDLFDNVVIKGGINYYLHSNQYSGMVEFYNCYKGERIKQNRNLFEDGIDIIVDSKENYEIIRKVTTSLGFSSIINITTGRNAFGIIGKESVINEISKAIPFKGCAKLRCKGDEIRYIDPKIIKKGKDIFENYKVFISKSAGDPKSDLNIIGIPYVGENKTACTDSLFPIGNFTNKKEAENLSKYLKTKFVRYMISILKSSQNVTQIVYRFVPIQDFTNNSDINWSQSISDIDKQLYKKYDLLNEMEYIETIIKPME